MFQANGCKKQACIAILICKNRLHTKMNKKKYGRILHTYQRKNKSREQFTSYHLCHKHKGNQILLGNIIIA